MSFLVDLVCEWLWFEAGSKASRQVWHYANREQFKRKRLDNIHRIGSRRVSSRPASI